jgi:hypothetical protein
VFGTHRDDTADGLHKKFFTRKGVTLLPGLQALFFLNANGKALHVAGYAGNMQFMNVSGREPNRCGTLRTRDELERMYYTLKTELRTLDEEKWR